MEKISVEVLSQASNRPVIQYPGRKFPGILIQGDTVMNLSVAAQALKELDVGSEEYRHELDGLAEQLASLKHHYEEVLRANNMALPY